MGITLISIRQTSTGDLYRVYERILQLVNAQFVEDQAEVAKQKARVPHKANRALYAPFIGLISTSALHKVVEQHEKSQTPSFVLECQARSNGQWACLVDISFVTGRNLASEFCLRTFIDTGTLILSIQYRRRIPYSTRNF